MTRLLLDTHLVLWWLNADPRLPDEVVQRVHAPSHGHRPKPRPHGTSPTIWPTVSWGSGFAFART